MNPPLFGTPCRCHGLPSLIILSREGGFVTQNCVETGHARAIHLHELPQVDCAKCKVVMQPFTNSETKNYAYRWPKCGLAVEVRAIVPHWRDQFEYFGYALDSDHIAQLPARQSLDLQEIVNRLRAGDAQP